MNFSHLAIIVALTCFAGSSGCYLLAFSTGNHQKNLNRIALAMFAIAAILMSYVSYDSLSSGLHDLASGFLLITLLAWLTMIAQLVFKIQSAGTFVAPIVTLINLVHLFTAVPHTGSGNEAQPSLLLSHIYCSLVGQAFAILAMAIAIVLLAQQRAMKKKQLHKLLDSGQNLNLLEKSLLFCLWLGFCFITVGLVLGAVYTQFYAQNGVGAIGKITWAVLVWVCYLVTLLAKNVFNVPIRRVSIMTLFGFGVMALGFFGLLSSQGL